MRATTALQVADAVFMAEDAVGRARRVVDVLHATINSALRVLDDAELDSAKAELSDRGDYYLESAGEHLSRLQRRCSDNTELAEELIGHMERASQAIADAHDLLQDAGTSDPVIASEVARLKPRLAVVCELIDLAKPMARLTARHVDSAQMATQQVAPLSLLEPVTLERSIAVASKELGRADEDVCLLESVVDHAAVNARKSAGIAGDITDTTRRGMVEQDRSQLSRRALPSSGPPR